MPVIVTAVFHPLPDQRGSLVSVLTASIPAVHAEDGCRLYAIHDAEDGTVTMLEKWDSRAQLDAHAAGPAVAKLDEAVRNFIAEPTTVTVMTPLPAGTTEQGEL
ncbi:putative quinol monooxygenase [Rathayibacter sp. YIM 133350]|uniref:putative quinol monooxygenase n=1 Tax=Rathayibacter sp. YIM 133350 TaxID=3131992 RepID=UPI00307F35F1